MAANGLQQWAGSLLQHFGFLAIASGLTTLAYQTSLWWIDGAWPSLQFGWLWYRFSSDLPDLYWPGERLAVFWLLDRPLSAVLLAAGATAYGFGRALASA